MVSFNAYTDQKPHAISQNRQLSTKELLQISVCQYLILHNSYSSQESLRQSLQQHGFSSISQSTVSRLLKQLGVVKALNARGEKVYKIVQPQEFSVTCCVADMILSVEYNQQFILIHTLPACASYVAKMLDPGKINGILGRVAGNDIVWITVEGSQKIQCIYHDINEFFKIQTKAL